MKKIILTGGGTAGHVTPNMALIPYLKDLGYEIHYIGTKDGIERKLIESCGVTYHIISAGKLRRYLSFKNVSDIYKVLKGFKEAFFIIRRLKPDLVFSKGGFVSTPVVWAAYLNRIPAIIHESDITPGLANKLSMPFARKICYTFPETEKFIPRDKGVLTGLPVRPMLFNGNKAQGQKLCGFTRSKPVILIIGGSQGSEIINKTVRDALNRLLHDFQVCHICGKGGVDETINVSGYKQFEYVNEELAHIFAMADLVISRAGATSLFELLALKKPNLLIPLSTKVSRGDQVLNARSFEKQGFSRVLMEEELNEKSLIEMVKKTYAESPKIKNAMENWKYGNGLTNVLKVIKEML